MNVYIITVQNDMKQQLVFHAESVSEALEQAKQAYKESMVTGDNNGEQRIQPLSERPKVVYNQHNSRFFPRVERIKLTDEQKAERKEQRHQAVLAEIPD